MKTHLTAVVVMAALTIMAVAVVLQSQTLQFGRFSWTCVGLIPFTGKALHVVKYEDETLCAEWLDEVEAPWVRANADRTLTVSYGRVGQETSVHYSIDTKNYVGAPPAHLYGFDVNFGALAQGTHSESYGREVSTFSRRLGAWNH